ncbi:sensor of ECF-type sigma factor [Flavobacterium sp.]|jgi:Spy/CpxP family protein refolding chaperone|uniref:sensor of ECF-type sigma factor n=1 Tax=Flavobacterium sp. TaxID=239 RepID=UPI0022CC5F38|nr:sensor of ECF-type sigma factor [Flavobacterium sp.]MCZ8228769.1 sensor of ECF-type sigma factor [Flavobacterium sp.]
MTIKRLFPYLFLLLSVTIYGQNERLKEKKDQIKAMKVAFLTSELNLTSDEAEKFWPVYNTYDDKQFELRHQKMKTYAKKLNEGSLDNMSDKEALAFLNQMESTDEELYSIRKKFNSALRNILPPTKILKLRKSEVDFDRKLLQKYRNRN